MPQRLGREVYDGRTAAKREQLTVDAADYVDRGAPAAAQRPTGASPAAAQPRGGEPRFGADRQRSSSPERPRTQRQTARSQRPSAARPSAQRQQANRGAAARPQARPTSRTRRAQQPQPAPAATQRKGMEPKELLSGAPEFAQWLSIRIFAGIMAVGLVVGLLFFLRPTTSQLENRELTQFPAFSIETVLNGEYFAQLSLWYADTYPLREVLVGWSRSLTGLFGIQPQQQLVGSDQTADELPPAEQATNLNIEERKQVEVPTEQAMADDIQANVMGRLYVENGAAYSVYYFSQESVEQYATAISIAAQRLDGIANVYSIIVPNNSAVMLDEQTLNDLGGTDQSQAIDYFYSLYDPNVRTVRVLDALRASAKDEYLYFRSDHHWTADGSYIAYVLYCQRAEIDPVDKSTLETVTFEPFLGSYYTELDLPAMAENPDYVKAYYPNGTNDMIYWDEAGNPVESHVINDVSGWAENSLYNTFIAGDQAETHIYNPAFNDDSSVLVVKDSFGTCFVPWLVNNYQNTWVIDFRYTGQNIVDFVKEHEIQNVIFLNNIEIAGTTTVANMLTSEVTDSSAG